MQLGTFLSLTFPKNQKPSAACLPGGAAETKPGRCSAERTGGGRARWGGTKHADNWERFSPNSSKDAQNKTLVPDIANKHIIFLLLGGVLFVFICVWGLKPGQTWLLGQETEQLLGGGGIRSAAKDEKSESLSTTRDCRPRRQLHQDLTRPPA